MKAGDDDAPQQTTSAVTATDPAAGTARPEGLTQLAASALVPVAMAAIAGSPVGIALTGVSGSAGSRYLTGAIDRAASRLRRGPSQPPAPETVQDALVGEIRALLDGDQLVARSLVPELAEIMRCIGAIHPEADT
jgi:hypothetical protein